jgi:hypothetical protein
MRKVDLNMTAEFKYNVIKKLVETKGNKTAAELKLACTRRTINRMIKGYEQEGKAFFIHGNKGRTPANAVPEEIETKILTLYDNKYYDSNSGAHVISLFSLVQQRSSRRRYAGMSLSSASFVLQRWCDWGGCKWRHVGICFF